MIRVQRPPESVELREARHRHLSRAILACMANGGVLPPDHDFTGYQVAREPLYQAQHRKCAYCERWMGLAESPTEHFRPKDGAARVRGVKAGAGPGRWDTDVYWWLAWTWENLLFSCSTCNGTSHKGNFFPIVGTALAQGCYDLSAEDGLIVDPSREDPLDHIRWKPLNPLDSRDRWEWSPCAVGRKGGDTIEAFKMLNRDDLIPQISSMLQKEILPEVKKIEDLLAAHRRTEAEDVWQGIQDTRLYKEAAFLAAKWSALVYLRDLPGSSLQQLPEPPRPGPDLQPWVVPSGLPPEPAGIPHAAWVRLLADEQVDEALILILQASPLQLEALWTLLQAEHCRYRPTKQQLRDRLSALVSAGKLTILGDRHVVP